jgi:cytoskeletal protein RodZ
MLPQKIFCRFHFGSVVFIVVSVIGALALWLPQKIFTHADAMKNQKKNNSTHSQLAQRQRSSTDSSSKAINF